MIERYRLKVKEPPTPKPKSRKRAAAKHVYFTDEAVGRLKPKSKQYLVWDAWTVDRKRGPDPARGLCVLVSPRGAKSFRAVFYYPGSPNPHYLHLGRVGELSLVEARRRCGEVRGLAKQGIDPTAGDARKSDSFETAFKEYIENEQIGRRKNTSARETAGVVLKNCAGWKPRAVATLTYREVENLLAKIRDGDPANGIKPRPAAAVRIFAHLRDFFVWCVRRGTIKVSPMADMPSPATIESRTRFYSDTELNAIWKAADQLDPVEGSYVKLMMLLAIRKEELAGARWREFDDPAVPTLLTIPTVRVKMQASAKSRKRPVYIVPIVPLAQRLFKSLARRDETLVFPGLDADRLKAKLVERGAPKDFMLHAFRHTVATWLQNQGRSEWERGLVLNHSGSGSVTGGYSHGYPVELKRTMLTEWSGHIEALVQPEGVALLR